MTKQEKIKEAYGEYWEEMKPFVNKNGWFNKNSFWNNTFSFGVYENIDLLFTHKEDSMIPTIIANIENNNGWIKIESEDDLPILTIIYHVVINGKESKALYAGKNRWFVDGNDFPKTTEIHGITHYQPIIKPQPPIY
jgi:hypothetical protein